MYKSLLAATALVLSFSAFAHKGSGYKQKMTVPKNVEHCPNKMVLTESVISMLKEGVPEFSFMDGPVKWNAFSIAFHPTANVKVDYDTLDQLKNLDITYVSKQNDPNWCKVYFHPKDVETPDTVNSLTLEVSKNNVELIFLLKFLTVLQRRFTV